MDYRYHQSAPESSSYNTQSSVHPGGGHDSMAAHHDVYYSSQTGHIPCSYSTAGSSSYGRVTRPSDSELAGAIDPSYQSVAQREKSHPPIASHTQPRSSPDSAQSDSPPASAGSGAPPKGRKTRRERPRINLAENQPKTTQGKARERVYVACVQCRTRKIRCDGDKPTCYNCKRRPVAHDPCSYDTDPKRRGPDKVPGARQRMARAVQNQLDAQGIKPRRRRKRENNDSAPTTAAKPPPPLSQPILAVVSTPLTGLIASDVPSLDPQHIALGLSLDIPSAYSDQPISSSSVYPVTPLSAQTALHSPVQHIVPSSSFLQPLPVVPTPVSSHSTSYLSQRVPAVRSDRNLASIAISTSFTRRSTHSVSPVESLPYRDTSTSSQAYYPHGYITEIDTSDDGDDGNNLHAQPSLQFTRQVWWDSLLSLYHAPYANHLVPLSPGLRQEVASAVLTDLRFIFRASNYWFCFFHVPRFFATYSNPSTRHQIQPALVLTLLSMSIFFQSSEKGRGKAGRELALRLRDHAQSALEASFNSGWIDETLAQAAYLLALFEVCAHDMHSTARSNSSLVYLDSIIRSLQLTGLDADVPEATNFYSRSVPAVEGARQSTWPTVHHQHHQHPTPNSNPTGQLHPNPQTNTYPSTSTRDSHSVSGGCTCASLTLGRTWSQAQELTPMWIATPGWNPAWSDSEIRRESIRRLCWSSMVLAANHLNYSTAVRPTNSQLSLFIADPANYTLLFSGERLTPNIYGVSSKDTVWALYDRAFLLWHGCNNMRNDPHRSTEEKTNFAMRAWHAADSIEQALSTHTCDLERAFIFQGREYLFNTRMCLSYEFQRNIPLVTPDINHRKAIEWLKHQQNVAQRFIDLSSIMANVNASLARRPFFVFWFMGQISRSLRLWESTPDLLLALDVCKALLPPIDFLTALWPCIEQRRLLQVIRTKVGNACLAAGITPPPPAPLASLPY